MKMLAVVLAILSKLSVILKLELRNLSKGITSPIFLSIYTLPQHAFFKIINKANSKFDLKIKEVFRINWKKTNLNAQQNHLALTLSLKLPPPSPPSPLVLFCLCFFFVFFFVCLFVLLFFAFLFHLLFSLSLTLIIGIFHCLALCYYFISLQHILDHTFLFHLLFSHLYANYRHLLLS